MLRRWWNLPSPQMSGEYLRQVARSRINERREFFEAYGCGARLGLDVEDCETRACRRGLDLREQSRESGLDRWKEVFPVVGWEREQAKISQKTSQMEVLPVS